jgi:hypothetical protein
MIKQTRKILSTTILLILLSSIAYATLTPNAHAAEITTQEKSLALLDSLVGLNVSAYTVALNTQLDNQFLSLPQKEADLSLTSSQGSLRARCSFVNNTLRQIYISDYSGTISLKQPIKNTLEMAQSFLDRYRQYTSDSFYSELKSTIDAIDVSKNTTKTEGNIKLEVSVFNEKHVNFIWTYISKEGILAPSKNVVLSYDQGFLKSFLDNWHRYRIAGEPKISSEEAVAIALKATDEFSYKVDVDDDTQTVSEFKIVAIGNTTLYYLNYMDQSSARDADPFTLYPSWYVPLGFDKFYPGGVTGVTLRIWADTAEVSSMDPMISGGTSPSSNKNSVYEAPNQNSSILLTSVGIAIVVGVIAISLSCKTAGYARLKRIVIGSRLWAISMCLLISFSLN